MSNILISNGTCYTAAGQKLDESFVPCGNDAFGHHTCCGRGDTCLFDNACFGVHGTGYGSSLTYWAGCSDPDYEDKTCPQKGFDQPWVALTLCDDSDGAWAACSQSGDPSTLQPGSFCSCTDAAKTTVAFKDSNLLSSSASLPQSTGQSINFFAGFTPTTPPSPGTTGGDDGDDSSDSSGSGPSSAGSSSGGPASNSAARTTSQSGSSGGSTSRRTTVSSSTRTQGTLTTVVSETVTLSGSAASTGGTDPASQDGGKDSGLGTGAKAGIGVGAAIVVLAAIAALLLFLRRRKRRPPPFKLESTTTYDHKPPIENPTEPERVFAKVVPPDMPEADGQPVSEVAGRPTQPWAMRSELEGSPVEPRAPVLRAPESRAPAPQGPVELPIRNGRTNIAENF